MDTSAAKAAGEESDDGIDWEPVRSTPPQKWSDELKAKMIASGHDPARVARRMKHHRDRPVWREAMATDPDEWSDELRSKLLALKPGSTIEEIAEGVRKRRVWREASQMAPEEWSDELKSKLLEIKPGSTIEEIADRMQRRRHRRGDLDGIRRRIRAAVESGEITPEEGRRKMRAVRRKRHRRSDGDSRLREFQRQVKKEALAIPPEEWSDELKAKIIRAGWDLNTFTERIRQYQQKVSDSAN